MVKTKKVGSTGRFGVRYGLNMRKSVRAIDELRKTKWECPNCLKPSVKREAPGIWFCKACNHKFAGRAYSPE